MSMAGTASGSFSGGRVFSRTVEAIQRNAQAFGLVGLLFFGLPSAIVQWMTLPLRQNMLQGQFSPTEYGSIGFMGLIAGAVGLIGYAGLIWGYWADTGGRRPSFDAMLKSGVSGALPLLGVGFCMGLAIALGFVLLVVPGVILCVLWCVAIPAQVVERPPGLGALGRSRDLTRGNRWAIFGLLLLYVVAAWCIGIVFGLLFGLGAGVSGLLGGFLSGPLGVIQVFLGALLKTVLGVFGVVFGAALYYELRSIKDGLAPESLSKVFE